VYRVRALFNDYSDGGTRADVQGLRGVSPRNIGFFWRSAHIRSEASVLAGFLCLFGALPTDALAAPSELVPSLLAAELICRAVEQFESLAPQSSITVEYAILLLSELIRGVEMAFGLCPRCRALILIDRLAIGERLCAFCAHETQSGHPYSLPKPEDEGRQGTLF
jgi:hypothetical protein